MFRPFGHRRVLIGLIGFRLHGLGLGYLLVLGPRFVPLLNAISFSKGSFVTACYRAEF